MNKKITNNQLHSFHLVDPSPWPILTAFSAFLLTFGTAGYMHGYATSFIVKYSLALTTYIAACWWRDVLRESTFEGQHTSAVQAGLRLGMLLFITTEVMFFFAFFWAFFHSSFNADTGIGGTWPPFEVAIIGPWGLPFVNSLILVTSGAAVTAAHHFLINGNRQHTADFLALTISLAIGFLYYQSSEYRLLPFNISDSIYAACFYITTGFHGFHVFIGTCFLAVMLYRIEKEKNLTRAHHIGLESAILYWHFVDLYGYFYSLPFTGGALNKSTSL